MAELVELTQLTEGPPRDQVCQLQGVCQPGSGGGGGGAAVLGVVARPVLAGLGSVLGALHLLVHLILRGRVR